MGKEALAEALPYMKQACPPPGGRIVTEDGGGKETGGGVSDTMTLSIGPAFI